MRVLLTTGRDSTGLREALAEWRPVVDEELERILPRRFDDAYLAGDPREYLPYACVPELLHNGTILVDDIQDGAELRRGDTAVHRTHGVDVALNAGNALYFLPLKVVARSPVDLGVEARLRTWEMLVEELNRTHLGQGMDIRWHNERAIDVTESEYFEMCACKTGCLARIAARLAAVVTGQSAETERAVAEYAERLSVAFQIADDLLDVERARRGRCVREGAGPGERGSGDACARLARTSDQLRSV